MNWNYNWQRSVWLSDDGRRVTEEQLANMDPFAEGMLRQVLSEGSKASNGEHDKANAGL